MPDLINICARLHAALMWISFVRINILPVGFYLIKVTYKKEILSSVSKIRDIVIVMIYLVLL